MIYDCFSFFNELDLLEIRLRTLDSVVDRFVLSESRFTHTGKPKPLYYRENAARFKAFADRIIHVVAADPEPPRDGPEDEAFSWMRENAQRNATVDAILPRLRDDDLLLVSDLDEIPSPHAVRAARRLGRPVRFRQRMYYYYANYRNCTSPYWYGTVALTFRDFKDARTYRHLETGLAFPSSRRAAPSASKVRALKTIRILHDGGWHFSYLGGLPMIRRKLASIVEGSLAGDVSDAFIADCLAGGYDIFRRGERYFAEPAKRGFPPALADFPQYVFPVDAAYLRRARIPRLLAALKGRVRPIAWRVLPHSLVSWLARMTNPAPSSPGA
ncbi:MAG: hypothetical protein ACI4R9_02905 [Kiritimatiellia bacterium]